MTVSVRTLGCKTNQFESQAMEKMLAARGYTVVSAHTTADAYIVNTCTVTANADRKSRQLIRRLKASGGGTAPFVAVCGCMAQCDPAVAKACGADCIGGNRDHAGFVRAVDAALRQETPADCKPAGDIQGFHVLPPGGIAERTRALLKIEDGCENQCSYCIIPTARGNVRSLPLAGAVQAAKQLAAEGYREIVLTGIEISAYGSDLQPASDLTVLTAAVCAAVPETRIALGSLKPTAADAAFCDALRGFRNLCGHFHLSIQSGSTDILRRMHRRYTAEDVAEAVKRLRTAFDRPTLTADFIVGFPGETDAMFEETIALVQACALADLHVFPYSARPGTPAASMPGRIKRQEAEARAARLQAVGRALKRAHLDAQIGREATVLVEKKTGGLPGGHTENYCYTRITNKPDAASGAFVPVRITGHDGEALYGEA